MALALSSRLILRALDRHTLGGKMPDDDLSTLRAATDQPMLPYWLARRGLRAVEEATIAGPQSPLRLRLYRPRAPIGGVVLFVHGGGFVHCGLESHDAICCRLARRSGSVVVAVDYRLAPEHPFPAATEDVYAALLWVADNARRLGSRRIVVAGDSAGGNLAAAATLMARDRGGPAIAFQLLYYPPTCGIVDVPSRTSNAEGYFLTTEAMLWYLSKYMDASGHDHPYFAVAGADLSGLPPAAIFTAEYDPLRDEGEVYADRLRAAGVTVQYRCLPGTIHGFLSFYAMQPRARAALDAGAAAVRAALGR